MKVRNFIKNAYLIIVSLVLLPGCGKIVDWGKETFNQKTSLDTQRDAVKNYMHSVVSYDQLSTVAKFDVLWLSDEVRTAYADLFTLKFGKTEEQRKTFLRRQLEENNHFITFYVLSSYERPLGDPTSDWVLFLNIGNRNFAPIEVKSADLSPEYIYFFGKKYNNFKQAYSVKFGATDIEDQSIISPSTKNINLYFRSAENEVFLAWNVDNINENSKKVIA